MSSFNDIEINKFSIFVCKTDKESLVLDKFVLAIQTL